MRIADSTQYRAVQDNISRAQSRHIAAAREAASGLRVAAPSDDPVAAAQALRVQHAADRTQSFRSSIRTVRGDVEMAETSLTNASEIMRRMQELSVEAANGTTGADDRKTIGIEVGQLRDQLVALANQKGTQGYLFGGTKTQSAPFDPSGAFSGDDLDRTAEVGYGVLMTVNTSGAKAFTAAGGRDVFDDIDNFLTALNSNDQSGVSASVSNLDGAARQILAARVDAGLKLGRLDASDAAHEEASVALATEQGNLVGTNPATAYSRLAEMQIGLEQAISVSKSLLDTLSQSTMR